MPVFFDIQTPVHPQDGQALRDVLNFVTHPQNDMNHARLPDSIVLEPGDAAYIVGKKKDIQNYIAYFWSQKQFESSDQMNLGCVAILAKHHIWHAVKSIGVGAAVAAGSYRKLLPRRRAGQGAAGGDAGMRNLISDLEGGHWRGPNVKEKNRLKKVGQKAMRTGLGTLFGNEGMILQVFHTDTADFGPVGDAANGVRLCNDVLTFATLAVYCSIWSTRTTF